MPSLPSAKGFGLQGDRNLEHEHRHLERLSDDDQDEDHTEAHEDVTSEANQELHVVRNNLGRHYVTR